MDTKRAQQKLVPANRDQTMAVVRAMMGVTGGREDEDHPLPSGPWDPVIRVALERCLTAIPSPTFWRESVQGQQHGWSAMGSVHAPRPEPWKSLLTLVATRYPGIREVIDDGFAQEVALNPHPLPPSPSPERFAFLASLAHVVVERAELFHEMAGAVHRDGELTSIIIVSGHAARFAEDICGNDFRFRWPFPFPRPNWFVEKISALDLLVVAVHFEPEAKAAFSRGLRSELEGASRKLADAGLARL